ncbi:hypothetical protein F4780DRAFT_265834 [Xylariomycetidae sp. FL0641]|nr:hypothetical protein F4780DRAFT_265834 [Xylariomycetidae sp. FL0641]
MDPITIVGALASTIQLLDVSVKTVSKLGSAIASLRHAKKDVLRLQEELEEAKNLMKNLQIWATILQQSPSKALQYQQIIDSIVDISQRFSADIDALHELLPTGNTLSLAKKLGFLSVKNAVADILRRLEQRKSATLLTLNIIERIDNSTRRHDTESVRDRIDALSSEHRDFSKQQEAHQKTLLTRYQESLESQKAIHISIQTLQEHLGRGDCPASRVENGLEQANERLLALTGRAGSTMALQEQSANSLHRLERMLPAQHREIHSGFASMRTTIATENWRTRRMITSSRRSSAVENTDILGRVLRAELQNQLGPLAQQIEGMKDVIERTALDVSRYSHESGIFESSPANLETNHAIPCSDTPHSRIGGSEEPFRNTRVTLYEPGRQKASREAELFRFEKWMKTKFGNLFVTGCTYRFRHTLDHHGSVYFRLQVTVIPAPWILPHAVSLSYSSGPDVYGFYAICPSIMPLRVVDFKEHEEVFQNDDLLSFRQLLDQRVLTPRDVHTNGWNLFEIVLTHQATEIWRFLLQNADPATFVDQLHPGRVVFCAACIYLHLPGYDLKRARKMFALLKYDVEIVNGVPYIEFEGCAAWLLVLVRELCLKAGLAMDYSRYREMMYLLREYGFDLAPELSFTGDTDKDTFILSLYLDTGGDPGKTNELGVDLLCRVMQMMAEIGTYESRSDGSLPRLLISAGADVHIVRHGGELWADWWTLHELAVYFGVLNTWKGALETCGLKFKDVFACSEQRRFAYRRLHAATRTGVDVEDVVGQRGSCEFRYRGKTSDIVEYYAEWPRWSGGFVPKDERDHCKMN